MYLANMWLAFICECIVRQCIVIAKLKCPGCEAKLKSPLLHMHEQLSLQEKVKTYFEQSRGMHLTKIQQLYHQITQKLPHSDNLEKDQIAYMENARQFLLSVTPDAVYWGRYVTEFEDAVINECFKTTPKRRPPPPAYTSRSKKCKATSDPSTSTMNVITLDDSAPISSKLPDYGDDLLTFLTQ